MEILAGILIMIVYLLLFAYPILAAIQVLYSIACYFRKGYAAAFYSDLRTYALISIIYILFGIYLFSPALSFLVPFDPSNLGFLYFFIMPLPIALYNIIIMKREYPEEIEKLIF